MTDLKEFAWSSNGDKWFAGKDDATGVTFVLHRGNAPSGGHETRSSVDAFLDQRPFGPEWDALMAFLEKDRADDEPAMASAFWKENIEPLDEKNRREVEVHLPSISDT